MCDRRREELLRVKSIFKNGDSKKIGEAVRSYFKTYALADVKVEEPYKELLTPLGGLF